MSDRKKRLYEVPEQLIGNAAEMLPAIEKMNRWVVDQAGLQGVDLQTLFLRMAEENQIVLANSNPINSLKTAPEGKSYLDAESMINSVFRLYEAPKVQSFLQDVARCICRARTCSTTDEGCDLGKPIRDAMQLLGELFPILRDKGKDAVLEPETFLSKFVAAFLVFGFKSPFSIGKECTHFCESACTQVNQKEGGLSGHVEISSMEYALEYYGALIGKSEENPYGLYKYLFLPPTDEQIKENGHIKIKVIGTGPASMQYALDMRREGYDVEMIEKESHMRGGERVPNFGGTWFNGVPYDKRPKEELMRYFYLMQEMGIKMTVAKVGKTPGYTIEELQADSDIIFNGAGLVSQPADLRAKGEKDASGKDLPQLIQAMALLQPCNEAVNEHVISGKGEEFDMLKLAEPYSGKTVVIVGAGYTEKDCTEWMAKFNHALKKAGRDEINIIILERQEKNKEGVRALHGLGWPNAPVTLEEELAAVIQGNIAGVDRRSAVVIDNIEPQADGRLKLTLDVRKLESPAGVWVHDKGERKYVHDQYIEVVCDNIIKALGFNNTRDNPSKLDYALGSVEPVQVPKRRGSEEMVSVDRVEVISNHAKQCGIFYGGDNNISDKGRASSSATLVAAFADGARAAEASKEAIMRGYHKNQKAWDENRADLKRADIASWLRSTQRENRTGAALSAA